jgi:acyl-CoA synthetase (AMP-forming)/AMP-acid ligase II
VKVGGEGFQTKIVDGILWIKAQSAMLGYLNAPSPFDADGWLCTQDAVEEEGEYLRILGRRTEIINVGGQKVYPGEVESVLLELENVNDATVYAEPNPLLGQIVAARLNLAEPEPLPDLKRRVRDHCRARLAAYKVPVKVEVTERDPYNARFKKLR